jgi:hypothetical protein
MWRSTVSGATSIGRSPRTGRSSTCSFPLTATHTVPVGSSDALSTWKVTPNEVVTDAAALYSAVLNELLPSAWHQVERVPLVIGFWLCCLGILADESIEDRLSVYMRPGRIRDRWWGRVDCRGRLSSGLVRPMPVVMDDVLAQGGEEMSFAVDEAVV